MPGRSSASFNMFPQFAQFFESHSVVCVCVVLFFGHKRNYVRLLLGKLGRAVPGL